MQGQKIAKKLSTQVSKETRNMKGLLEEYDACQAIASGNSGNLTLPDVLDPSALAKMLNPKLTAYKPDRQEIINAYIMLTRSKEEMEMLQREMGNVLHYYEDRVVVIQSVMDECSQLKSARGAHALLHNMLINTNVQLQKCKQLFTPLLFQHQAPISMCSDDSSDSSNDSDFSDHDELF
jgi:hypothetical protein